MPSMFQHADSVAQWDYTTSIEEVMNGLHALVMAGKVLYLVRFYLAYSPRSVLYTIFWNRVSLTLPPGLSPVRIATHA